ncbi:MAG: efflux RND transporter permease subunit [Candidatus Poribacteria bacterium]|nr:efflux RND transporter permease subunit [Candidatus Poribacteria bacterium]
MNLAKICVEHPVLAVMLNLVFIFLGIVSFSTLTMDLFPEVDIPVVNVRTIWRGAAPKEVESQITREVEDAVATISGIKSLESSSLDSISIVTIRFVSGTDVNFAHIDVKDKVDAMLARLPDGADPPIVEKFDLGASPIMELMLTGDQPLRELYRLADEDVKDTLSQVQGIASVDILGGEKREIQVNLSKERLKGYGLSITDVVRAIDVGNISMPAGRITQSKDEFTVRMQGEFTSLSELYHLDIFLQSGGAIKLGELASVDDALAEKRMTARYGGKEGISLSIVKLSDAQPIKLADDVRKTIEELEAQLPGDVRIEVIKDESINILDSVNDVQTNIIIGIILTSIVLYLFLHNLRMTIIVAVVMPTCILSAFLLMSTFGFTLNIMSMLGLGLSIGTLVVNAIVILENVTRRLDAGEPAKVAAVEGTKEVTIAVIGSTMTNIFVFIPIAFMSGIVGSFFIEFGLTVVFATIFSLWVSFTMTPMLAAYLLKPKAADHRPNAFFRLWNRGMQRLEDGYARILGWSLRYLWVNLLVAILLIVGSVLLASTLGSEFMPKSNGDFIIINVELPPGTTLAETDEMTLEMEAVLKASPEVEDVLTKIGRSGRANEGVEYAELLVVLPKGHKKHILEVNDELRAVLEGKFPGVIRQQVLPGTGGLPGGADIKIELLGSETEKLTEITNQVKGIVDNMPELVETKTTVRTGKPELTFFPDRNRLKDYGITVAEIGQVLNYSLTGAVASTYQEGDEAYDIRVQLAKADVSIAEHVDRVLIRTQKGLVPLSALGTLIERSGETQIARKNKQRLFVVEANIITGSLGAVTRQIQQQVNQIALPPGYGIRMGGDAEEQAESFQAIGVALVQAIILTYMLLAALLGSYRHPFTIMLTLPLGFVGAVLSMSLFGLSINIFSLLALIMLIGIVVNDAILLLDQTRIFREEGLPIKEALLKACPLKLRTIIMTNLTIVISMFPQTLGDRGTAIMRATLAGVEIGAIIVQTACTLTIIPVLYVILERFSNRSQDADASDMSKE